MWAWSGPLREVPHRQRHRPGAPERRPNPGGGRHQVPPTGLLTPPDRPRQLPFMAMARSGPVGPGSEPPPGGRAGTSSTEEGLRALGSLMEGAQPTTPSAGAAAGRAGTNGRHRRSRPTRTFDESGLRSLGDQVNRSNGSRRHRSRRHRKTKWILGSVAVLLLVAVGGTAGYGWYLNHEIHRFDVHGLADVPTAGADAGTENILMVGSTDRCALKVQNASYGLCSQGVNGVNSDVVMILHLDPNKRSVSILSIPRDLFVPNARTNGANKIDAALYQGPSQLVAAINEDLGIPIQHYVVLNFDTFANVVDALGGVKMYFPQPVYDAYSGLKVLTPGCLNVDGKFSTSDMVNLVLDFHSVNVNSAPQLTLPVQVDQFGSYEYQGASYGDIEFPASAQDQQVIDQFLGIDANTDSMNGQKLPAPAGVSVSVLNGTGAYNQATDTKSALQALGFNVVGIGDSPPVGAEAETVVYYAQKTPADEAAAQAVARSLSGAVITALGPTTDGAQVTVVTGSQFTVNPPAAASPTTSPAAAGGLTVN